MIQRNIGLVWHGTVVAKKNSKRMITNPRTGKPMPISNERAKMQEEDMAWDFSVEARKRNWQPREGARYHVFIHIYTPDWHRRDLDNMATAILDALVLGGIIPDDNIKYVFDLHVTFMGVDKEDPRAEIEVAQEMNTPWIKP
jgi:Holliday junction resolvase RusA-like endonuclease